MTFLEENENTPKAAKHPAYPKCWKGSVIVFDTERKNTLVSLVVGCCSGKIAMSDIYVRLIVHMQKSHGLFKQVCYTSVNNLQQWCLSSCYKLGMATGKAMQTILDCYTSVNNLQQWCLSSCYKLGMATGKAMQTILDLLEQCVTNLMQLSALLKPETSCLRLTDS